MMMMMMMLLLGGRRLGETATSGAAARQNETILGHKDAEMVTGGNLENGVRTEGFDERWTAYLGQRGAQTELTGEADAPGVDATVHSESEVVRGALH